MQATNSGPERPGGTGKLSGSFWILCCGWVARPGRLSLPSFLCSPGSTWCLGPRAWALLLPKQQILLVRFGWLPRIFGVAFIPFRDGSQDLPVSSCSLFTHECGHGRARNARVGAFNRGEKRFLFSSGDLQRRRMGTSKHVLWLLWRGQVDFCLQSQTGLFQPKIWMVQVRDK